MPVYTPSIGDLARQWLGNEFEKGMKPVKDFGNLASTVTGREGISDFTGRMSDATSIRSGGKLPDPSASGQDLQQAGLKMVAGSLIPGGEMLVGGDLSKDIRAGQQNRQTEEDAKWQANLKNFYPDVF